MSGRHSANYLGLNGQDASWPSWPYRGIHCSFVSGSWKWRYIHKGNPWKSSKTWGFYFCYSRSYSWAWRRFLYGSSFFRFDLAFEPIAGFFARKSTESAVCFSEWVHVLSVRYPMQKIACLPAQFELLPTSRIRTLKIWSNSKSKNGPIFERETTADYYSPVYAPWVKPRTTSTPTETRGFELGTHRRDCIGSEKCGWNPQLVGKIEHERKKSSKSNRMEYDPHRKNL